MHLCDEKFLRWIRRNSVEVATVVALIVDGVVASSSSSVPSSPAGRQAEVGLRALRRRQRRRGHGGVAGLGTTAVGAQDLCAVRQEAPTDEGGGAPIADETLAVPMAVVK